jgi:uncharacterized protein YbjT (DUF2867 family)
MTKWVLTGSTGVLGSKVLQHLLEFGFNPQDIILSVYNPEGVDPQLAKILFDVRHGDYNRKETLEKAFQGAEILFLVSSTTIINEKRTAEHRNAIDAAKNVGIKHIYYTSLSIGNTREVEIMGAHLDTEDLIKASGLKYTIIREGIYSEVFPVFLGYFDANTTTEIVIPADGGIPFVARDDLGEATAKILVAPTDTYENKTIILTGSKTYTLKETASIISKILGRDIPLRFVSLQEYIDRNLKGQDEVWVRLWATTYPALQRGEITRIDPTLEKLLGRQPKPFEQTIKEFLTNKETDAKEAQLYNKYLQASTLNKK